MTLEDFLGRVLSVVEELSIPYMLTGSLASAYYAVPRATRDVDLVIAVSSEELERLVRGLGEAGFYVSEAAAREALRTEGQFNAIDPESGWKADFIPRKERPFSRVEFDRRDRVELLGRELSLVTAEDLIVAKLEWARKGGSERQVRDVRGILAQSGPALDREHLERWVGELGLDEEWRAVLEHADRCEEG